MIYLCVGCPAPALRLLKGEVIPKATDARVLAMVSSHRQIKLQARASWHARPKKHEPELSPGRFPGLFKLEAVARGCGCVPSTRRLAKHPLASPTRSGLAPPSLSQSFNPSALPDRGRLFPPVALLRGARRAFLHTPALRARSRHPR